MKNIKNYSDFLNEVQYPNFDYMEDEPNLWLITPQVLKYLLEKERRFSQLGILDDAEYRSLYKKIKKISPEMTVGRLRDLFKYVGEISTIDSVLPEDESDLKIIDVIESYLGL